MTYKMCYRIIESFCPRFSLFFLINSRKQTKTEIQRYFNQDQILFYYYSIIIPSIKMSSILSNNWENFFKDRPSNELSDKTMADLFSSFNAGKSLDECLSAAIEEQDTVFLAKALITNHIMFLHHFSKVGGTRTMPTARVFALVGTGESAFPAQLNKEVLFNTTDTKYPTWASFTSLKDSADVSKITIRANASNKAIRNCIPLPPFLAAALIDQGGASIPDLITCAITSIRAFDEAHKDDSDVNFFKADTACQNIVYWLFAASQDKNAIDPLAAIPSIDPVIIVNSNAIHGDHIASNETVVNPNSSLDNSEALTQLASNVNEQTTVLQQINISAEERKNEKKKGISSIHPSFQKMILAASSKDGTDVPIDPVKNCTDFFKQKSAVHAQIHLNQTLHSVFKCSVIVPVSLATALYHGNFLWDRADTPNNFCSFLLGKPPPLSQNGSKEIMMLHLKASKGSGWSDQDLEKAIHQAIGCATTIDGMLHTLYNLSSAAEFYWGKESIGTIGLKSWRTHITANLMLYESLAASDKEFIVKVLCAIDTRVNC